MTKLKKILRFFLYAGAASLLLGAIRLAGYFYVQDSTLATPECLASLCLFMFLVGAMVLAAGLLTEKEDSKAKQRRYSICLGLFFLSGSVVVVFIAQLLINSGV